MLLYYIYLDYLLNFSLTWESYSIVGTPRPSYKGEGGGGQVLELFEKRGGVQIFPIKMDGLVK